MIVGVINLTAIVADAKILQAPAYQANLISYVMPSSHSLRKQPEKEINELRSDHLPCWQHRRSKFGYFKLGAIFLGGL